MPRIQDFSILCPNIEGSNLILCGRLLLCIWTEIMSLTQETKLLWFVRILPPCCVDIVGVNRSVGVTTKDTRESCSCSLALYPAI